MDVIAKRKNKTIYRDGDNIIKMFDESFKTSAILNESLNQARVIEAGIKVPHLVEVKKIDGKWAIVSKFIEGETLAALMEKNPDKMDEYLSLFVDIQMSIHAKSEPLLNKLIDKMTMKISQTAFDATIRYELMIRLESMPKHKKICHGDFNPENIIIDANGDYHVIDWSHVTQGNASADVARTYLLFYLEGKKELGEKYLKLFCKKSDTARQYVEKWIPIVAASQSVKGMEEQAKMLEHLVDVVEYE